MNRHEIELRMDDLKTEKINLEKVIISKRNASLSVGIKISFTDKYKETISNVYGTSYRISFNIGNFDHDGWIVFNFVGKFCVWQFLTLHEFDSQLEVIGDL